MQQRMTTLSYPSSKEILVCIDDYIILEPALALLILIVALLKNKGNLYGKLQGTNNH